MRRPFANGLAHWSAWTAAIGAATLATSTLAFWATHGAREARSGMNHFPNVTLTTQDGKRVRFYDDLIKGRVVLINFMFTTCKTELTRVQVKRLKAQLTCAEGDLSCNHP